MFKKNKIFLMDRFFFIFIFAIVTLFFVIVSFGLIVIKTGQYIYLFIIFLIAFFLIVYLFYKLIYLPQKETKKVLELFIRGYTMQGIFEMRHPFTKEFQAMLSKMKTLLQTDELINATKRQAQYLALQNQINPHFLYNTLEGIRSDALMAGLDTVAETTKALATFFRYTISNVEKLVTLEDEIHNINNYFFIQKYRFEERINLKITCEDDYNIAKSYLLPKLTLQPIVENAIIHGIEQKIGNGLIIINIQLTEKRLIITISDNGVGMREESLKQLDEKLNTMSLEYMNQDGDKKGGIAIVNVNNRIKLIFGEQYGIHIYSTFGAGTDVELTIPLVAKDVSI